MGHVPAGLRPEWYTARDVRGVEQELTALKDPVDALKAGFLR